MKRVGITGHQGLDPDTAVAIQGQLAGEITARGRICAIGSLAEGADQIFAEEALRQDGTLLVVIPSAHYERSFSDPIALARFQRLRGRASEVIELDYPAPEEEAYWAAGRRVVDLSDEMVAVWDGKKAGGLGGTADVVDYARHNHVPVSVIWPAGSSRA